MDFTKCVTLLGALLLLSAFIPAEACRCLIVDHLQVPYCSSPAVIKAIFIKPAQREPISPSTNNRTGYDSQTLEVLKGNSVLQDSTFIDSYSAGDSCQYSHPADGFNTTYLVLGPVIDGNVGVGGCSFPTPWSKLKAKQITGLKGDYEPGCGKCKIIRDGMNPCDSPPCENANKTCVLVDDNQKENQACLPDGDTCTWKTI